MRRTLVVLLGPLLAGTLLAGCGADGPEVSPLPDGVDVVLDQRRTQRLAGEVLVRIRAETSADVVVTGMTLTSSRAVEPVAWTGAETVRAGYERDIDVAPPDGTCGGPPTFTVELVYRLGDGPQRVSRTTAEDRYGAVTRLLDADCVHTTVEERVDVRTGTPVVDGDVLRLPVRLGPADGSQDAGLTLVGYGDTPLLRQTPASARDVPVGSEDVEADLVVEPARCDPHAVAEDKVGTLFAVEVEGPGLPTGASYELPLGREQRSAFLTFVRQACGLG